jgi:hypothetical protein
LEAGRGPPAQPLDVGVRGAGPHVAWHVGTRDLLWSLDSGLETTGGLALELGSWE